MGARVLLIDNYDSFTYNLVQEMGALGADPVVYRNDAISVAAIRELRPDGIVISPGPGRPEDGGVSMAVVSELGGETPVLGVCLGHQCIGQVFGARIVSAPELMHGKTSAIFHTGVGVFADMPNPFDATRYHSLDRRPRLHPRRPGDHRRDDRRHRDGAPTPGDGHRRGPIPPRVDPDHRRTGPAHQLPRLAGSVPNPAVAPPQERTQVGRAQLKRT